MMDEWRTTTVRDLVNEGVLDRPMDGNHGEIHPKTSDFVEKGIPFIMASDVVDGRVDTEHCAFITEKHASALRKGFAHTGDVLISHKATMGRTAIVGKLDVPFLMLTPQVTYYRVCDRSRLNPLYLKYYFDSPEFQVLFDTWGQKGSTRAYLGITSQLDLPMVLPPPDEQDAIAHILGTLDDKIELNRRMNEMLEAMARALFKSWFVDFDPVRAKSEGRDPGLPKPLADLFPDSFEDSELGEIPQGWRSGRIGDVADSPRRGIQPSEIEPSTPYIALEHMPRRRIALSEWDIADGLESGKFEFKQGEILFGKLRPYFHKVGVAPVDGVCSTDIVVVAARSDKWFGFVLGHVSSETFVNYADAGSTGTKMPRTSWSEMGRYDVVLPPELLAAALTDQIRPLVARILSSIHESRTLAALRDTLLPKLISGELRLRTAERLVAEAQT